MASKIKVDELETVDGSGTIALQNQLSGMTSASMPTGSVLQVVEAGMNGTATHTAGASTYSTLFSGSLTNVAANSVVVGWVNIQGYMGSTGNDIAIACFQGSRVMGGGTAADSCDSGLIMNLRRNAGLENVRGNGMFIDSSPPTGTVQYDVQTINEGTFTVGRGYQTTAKRLLRPRNNIILMEIAG
jgi:hypothetical protein